MLYKDATKKQLLKEIEQLNSRISEFEKSELLKQQQEAELFLANQELTIQNKEKGKRAEELIIANQELAFQNKEKEKRATELIKSDEKYQILANNAHDFVYWIDPDGNWKYISPSCERVTGYSMDEFTKRPNLLEEITYPVDKEIVAHHLEHDKKEREDDYLELRIISKSGDMRWISHTCNPVYSDEGIYLGRRGANRDITKRKQSEEALLTSQQILEGIMNTINTRVFWKDKNLVYLGCNNSFAQDAGFLNSSEIIGKDDFQMGWDDRAEMYRKDDQEVLDSGIPKLLIEESLTTPDGSTITILTNKIPLLNDEGEVIGVLGTFLDISERKRVEQIQKVLYNISNAVMTTDNLEELISLIQDELGTVIYTANFYIALYDNDTDMLSLPYFADEKDTISTFPAGKTLTKYVITSQKPLLARAEQFKELEETEGIKKFGTNPEVWLGAPLKVEGEITGVLVVQSYTNKNAYDESDMHMLEFVSSQIGISIQRKKTEENLKNALVKATESDRLKSAFLATMSHELRTPLNAIIGFSDLIDEDLPINDIMEFKNTINRSGNHLLKIVEDIFDIALIEAGEFKILKEDFELENILKDVHDMIQIEQKRLNKPDLILNFDLPKEIGLIIYTDASKLKQILINLLKNALKFTHEGSINYGYTFEFLEEKPWLEFYVKDTGIGINTEAQELIFDMFRQVAESHNRLYEGTGIGLSISKKIIELLGGRIWVESQEGKGSVFYFTIPIEGYRIADKKSRSRTKEETAELSNFSEKTILIVDDIDSNFEFLEIILRKAGLKTLWAKNGKEAIEICLENPDIALVLMDIRMPLMNGYDATREIKRFKPNLPIIAQTAYVSGSDSYKAIDAGCDSYISKPIDKNKLFKIIENYIKS